MTNGLAAAAIATADGPSHGPLVSAETTVAYDDAAQPNSAASPAQAAAAASIDPEPGPAYISPELISGGNSPKSGTIPTLLSQGGGRRYRNWVATLSVASESTV
ncbi:hypothetical protein A5677_26150 [Mycobacterium malmoense]|uniref:Uncharacterized protein n=1 Tax=Mycobacterium malmoense TaxID=1780 RepID=A0A1B9CX47_MYCMA|nr:hypothetical protein A5677_26150 [Mycobacterium malmoense]